MLRLKNTLSEDSNIIRFEIDFYDKISDRLPSDEKIYASSTLADAIKFSKEKAISDNIAYVEIYYGNNFIGSLHKRDDYEFKKGKGFSLFSNKYPQNSITESLKKENVSEKKLNDKELLITIHSARQLVSPVIRDKITQAFEDGIKRENIKLRTAFTRNDYTDVIKDFNQLVDSVYEVKSSDNEAAKFFFRTTPYGRDINEILNGKWDAFYVKSYIDKLGRGAGQMDWVNSVKSIYESINMPSNVEHTTISSKINAIITRVEDLYKLYTENTILESNYEVYHNSYSSAVSAGLKYAKSNGYDIVEDDVWDQISVGPAKPSEGRTNRATIGLIKDGKPQRKALHMQIYGMGNGRYELNVYIR